jgi:hypothetical protein
MFRVSRQKTQQVDQKWDRDRKRTASYIVGLLYL